MKRMQLCAALLVVAPCNDMLAGPAASRLVRRATHAISARDIVVAGSAMAATYAYLKTGIKKAEWKAAYLAAGLSNLQSKREEQKQAFGQLRRERDAIKKALDTASADLAQLNQNTQEKMQELGCKLVPVFVAEGVESQLAGKKLVKRVSDLINEKSTQLCYLAAEGVLEEKLASGKAFKDEFEKLIQSLLAVSSSQLANKLCGTLFARDLRFPEAIKELQSTAFDLAARAVAWAAQKQTEILVHIEPVDANPAELSVGSDIGAMEQVRHEAFDPSI